MQWHVSSEDGVMRHLVDSKAWKEFDQQFPSFAVDACNARPGLVADGLNPFANMAIPYSMRPVVLTTYNLTLWLCMKESYLMLMLLIPGPSSPGKDIHVLLCPLVDELNELWSEQVVVRDSMTAKNFKLRATLLWTTNDFPARSSLSGWSGQGYKACPI